MPQVCAYHCYCTSCREMQKLQSTGFGDLLLFASPLLIPAGNLAAALSDLILHSFNLQAAEVLELCRSRAASLFTICQLNCANTSLFYLRFKTP